MINEVMKTQDETPLVSGQNHPNCSESLKVYKMAKKKIQLTPEIDVDAVLAEMAERKKSFDVNLIDGVKIDFPESWVHLRKSNTEPIIRIYSEASTFEKANDLADEIIEEIKSIIK